MKLVVEKVGRIEKAEIEIRPLTVFIGENGTNKTWTAMGLFALLQNSHGRGSNQLRTNQGVEQLLVDRASELVEKLDGTQGESSFEVKRSELLQSLPEQIDIWIDRIDGERLVGAELDLQARLSLVLTRQEFLRTQADLLLQLKLMPGQISATLVEGDADKRLVSTSYNTLDPKEAIQRQLATLLFAWIPRLRALPVERDFLSQKYTQVLVKGIPLSRGQQAFCELLAFAQARSSSTREDRELVQIAGSVIGGRFGFTPNASLVLNVVSGEQTVALPISGCASMQKSLAGLQFFLETAERGDFLIIDEPELSAHPEAQVKLVELFALMIRAGIQLVIITHSPYIIDHISTIIEMSRLNDEQRARAAEELALKNPNTFFKPDEVAVWHFGKDGQVTSKYNPENRTIDWRTFTQVSDQESLAVNRIIEEAVGGHRSDD